MHRLFVGLRPPAAVRAALLALAEAVPGIRWQHEDQLHLTLAFIGEVERPLAEDIAIALGRVNGPRPHMILEGLGSFERKGVANSLWVGCRPDAELSRLQGRVMQAVRLAGAGPEERRFHPHVTLARMGRHAGPIASLLDRYAGLRTDPFVADAMLLFESTLTANGSVYSAVARYPLR